MKTVRAKGVEITNNLKIAVIPENWYWKGVSSFLPRALITEFIDLGFTVIERSQLEALFGELKLDLSGVIKEKGVVDIEILDKTSIKKMGEMLGVDALLLTYIIPTSQDNISKATFRLVDVGTAKVLFSITLINPKNLESIPVRTIIDAISSNIEQVLNGKGKIITEPTLGSDERKVILIKPQTTIGERATFKLQDEIEFSGEIIELTADTMTVMIDRVERKTRILNRKALIKDANTGNYIQK